jgi:hypothetical protein
VTFRADIDAAKAKLDQLTHVLRARDEELARQDALLAAHDAEIAAAMPTEAHRVRLRQLDVAIAQARQETAQLRARAAERAGR